MLNLRFVVWMLSAGLPVFGAGVVCAQDYPSKPIRIITGTAGGGSDFVARIVAQGISAPLAQPVIIDNRAGGAFGDVVPKTPPDGYTVFLGGANLWILPLLQKVNYDFVRDSSPISLLVKEVNVLVVHPSLPVKNVKELIALAKARPGELNYSTGGIGTPNHLGAEMFKSMAGVKMVNIPYKGTTPAVTALLNGEVQMTIADPGLVEPFIKSGRLRALAATSAEPSALAPGLPTVAASGLPGYAAGGMTGLFAPAKTPATIINRLNQETVRVLNRADVIERFLDAGVEVVASSPAQFAATINAEITKASKVIKDAGIKVD